MTDFQNVASGDYVPGSSGRNVSIAALPGGNAKHPALMRCFAAHIGNFGTGNPVGKGQVQLVEGGNWVDVSGATITDNGSISFYAYGVAARWSVPTLTSPGTTTTAPRVAFTAQNLEVPNTLGRPVVEYGEHKFSDDLGTTSEVLSLPGHGRLNPDTNASGSNAKSIVVLSQEGAGTSFIESTYRDGDGDFKVQEGASLAGASGQVIVESFGEEHHVDFTDGSGTTDVRLSVFRMPI